MPQYLLTSIVRPVMPKSGGDSGWKRRCGSDAAKTKQAMEPHPPLAIDGSPHQCFYSLVDEMPCEPALIASSRCGCCGDQQSVRLRRRHSTMQKSSLPSFSPR